MNTNTEQATVAASIPALVALIVEADQAQGTEPDNAERSALAAVMHLCDSMDIDFNGLMTVAAMHYGDESDS